MIRIGLAICVYLCLVEYAVIQFLTYISAKLRGEKVDRRSHVWHL